ncbi:hypothetical protein DEU56DRAFT_880248 [Suillus clintonianus]|uniref:uncharacterized protein n=1 Tax=Suillus clintonianus TaxID=1904413 RepID=UPI001B873303|nr:uncharacterized protein DEU56DRAFT_880248 [Suillus clintonianus]KAG2151541.1 hypothetical protein DEU56DRAFT_880248 [Suillus clintonianus]
MTSSTMWLKSMSTPRTAGPMSVPRSVSPEEYVLLTSSPSAPRTTIYRRRHPCSWRNFIRMFTLRRVLISVTLVPVFLLLAIICQGIPPNYDDIRTFEQRLPQHSLSLVPRNQPQYLRFPGHLWGYGFNNVLQEAILMSYLAYVSNLSFVFEDYTWSHLPLPWTIYDFALRPAHIPLNALISGPTAGGPMPSAPNAYRAVSAEFYAQVCGPESRKHVISTLNAPNDADGAVMIDWWVDQLTNVQEPCIEIDSSAHIVFDSHFFGNPRILSLWESLTKSPMLTDFAWSPLVHAAVSRNFALFQPESAKDLYDAHSRKSLAGLVALHLRRGDYRRHCPNLEKWGADYMGINQHPSLPDRFDRSPYVNDTSARLSYYLDHCWPSTEQVVERLRDIRKEYPGLRRVYVLSNEWAWSLDGLKGALEEDGWDDLVSSTDIVLDSEQKHVAMAVDMAIAEKAEVFVGNGFSSLSSNVVMLRMAKGMEGQSNRFL